MNRLKEVIAQRNNRFNELLVLIVDALEHVHHFPLGIDTSVCVDFLVYLESACIDFG